MAAWRYEISLLMLKKYFTRSPRSLVKYFSTLEQKFRISVRPCNILYISMNANLNNANTEHNSHQNKEETINYHPHYNHLMVLQQILLGIL